MLRNTPIERVSIGFSEDTDAIREVLETLQKCKLERQLGSLKEISLTGSCVDDTIVRQASFLLSVSCKTNSSTSSTTEAGSGSSSSEGRLTEPARVTPSSSLVSLSATSHPSSREDDQADAASGCGRSPLARVVDIERGGPPHLDPRLSLCSSSEEAADKSEIRSLTIAHATRNRVSNLAVQWLELGGLETLVLFGAQLGNSGVQTLVTKLSLLVYGQEQPPTSPVTARGILRRGEPPPQFLPPLRHLVLYGREISNAGIGVLARGVRCLVSLEELVIGGTGFTDGNEVRALLRALLLDLPDLKRKHHAAIMRGAGADHTYVDHGGEEEAVGHTMSAPARASTTDRDFQNFEESCIPKNPCGMRKLGLLNYALGDSSMITLSNLLKLRPLSAPGELVVFAGRAAEKSFQALADAIAEVGVAHRE